MKTFRIQLFSLAIGTLALAAHWCCTLADGFADDAGLNVDGSKLVRLRELTPEEEALADTARAHIAKTIEDNLVHLFAIIAARGDRRARQDEEGVEDVEDLASATPNPNVLPQVAQILGAIFSGSLNLTRVVDQTFGLVPNLVRNQVGGLVKLLTGESMDETSTPLPDSVLATTIANLPPQSPLIVVTPSGVNPDAPAAPVVAPSAPTPESVSKTTPRAEATKASIIVESIDDEEIITKASVSNRNTTESSSSAQQSAADNKLKYRVKIRPTKSASTQKTPTTIVEDDEIERLEEEIRRAARAYEPYAREKQPRFFTTAFRNIFSRVDLNMTEIARAVPSIFKGARQAFTVLENLGILDVNEVLDELDLPTLEEEEEE